MRKLKENSIVENNTNLEKVVDQIAKHSEKKYTKVMQELNQMKPDEGKIIHKSSGMPNNGNLSRRINVKNVEIKRNV